MMLFSIVIPTFNRPKELAHCLSGLAQQTLPKSEFEIIIVDDSGTNAQKRQDASDTGIPNCPDLACRRFYQNHSGPATARNLGASHARGRYLAFTDDDCCPAPGWLESMLGHIQAHPDETLVGGRVINALSNNRYAAASQGLVDFLCTWFNTGEKQAMLLTSNNFCVPKAAFQHVGGFDTAFKDAGGEDREFCYRWASTGRRSPFAQKAIVYHYHDMTLHKFIRQHIAYGQGAAVLRRRSLAYGYGPIPMEPLSFYLDLLRYPLKNSEGDTPLIEASLFGLSQAANAAGYFFAAKKRWEN